MPENSLYHEGELQRLSSPSEKAVKIELRRFASGSYDTVTKLVKFGARDYDPETEMGFF